MPYKKLPSEKHRFKILCCNYLDVDSDSSLFQQPDNDSKCCNASAEQKQSENSNHSCLDMSHLEIRETALSEQLDCDMSQSNTGQSVKNTRSLEICLGVSTNLMPRWRLPQAVWYAAQYQFKHMELQLEYRARYDYNDPEVKLFLQKRKRDKGLDYTVHAPYLKLDLAAEDEDFRHHSCSQVSALLPFCSELGVTCLTVHTGRRAARGFEQLLRSLHNLVKQAQKYRVTICLENTGSDRPGWLLLNEQECFTACMETGCLLTLDLVHVFSSSLEPIAALKRLLPFAGNCHLADTYTHHHLHLPLGEGDLPVSSIFELFEQYSYQGKIIVDAIEQGYGPNVYLENATALAEKIYGKRT